MDELPTRNESNVLLPRSISVSASVSVSFRVEIGWSGFL